MQFEQNAKCNNSNMQFELPSCILIIWLDHEYIGWRRKKPGPRWWRNQYLLVKAGRETGGGGRGCPRELCLEDTRKTLIVF